MYLALLNNTYLFRLEANSLFTLFINSLTERDDINTAHITFRVHFCDMYRIISTNIWKEIARRGP